MIHNETGLSTLRASSRGEIADLAEAHGLTVSHVETHHGPAPGPATAARSDLWHLRIGENADAAELSLSLLRRVETTQSSLLRASVSCTLMTEQPRPSRRPHGSSEPGRPTAGTNS